MEEQYDACDSKQPEIFMLMDEISREIDAIRIKLQPVIREMPRTEDENKPNDTALISKAKVILKSLRSLNEDIYL